MAESNPPGSTNTQRGARGKGELEEMPAIVLGLLVIAVIAVGALRLWQRARDRAPEAAPLAPEPVAAVVAVPAPAHALPPASASGPVAESALSAAQVFERLHELAFAVSPLTPVVPERLAALESDVRSVLESVATEPRYAPRRPLLLPQLMRAIHDDDVSRRELAAIIARDPALAGSLLKLANSSFYRMSEKPVESVDRAVALLGSDGIRSLVATALLQPVFRLAPNEFPSFPETTWEHTYRAAAAAEAHAAIVEDSDPFAAQLLGLTLGLGSIIVFRVALDRCAARREQPAAAGLAALLDAHAAATARRVAASWELSGRILTALEDQVPASGLREPTSLGRSLFFGRLIGALALLHARERLSEPTAKAAMIASGATESQFERIWARLTGQRQPLPARRP